MYPILISVPVVSPRDVMVDEKLPPAEYVEPGEEEEGDIPGWGTILLDFTQSTSLHGVSYVTGDSKFVLRR